MSIFHSLAWGFLRGRLQERTTWAGIISFVAGMLGLAVKPEYMDAIVGIALALCSFVCLVVDDRRDRNVVLDPKPAASVDAAKRMSVPSEPSIPIRANGDRFGTGRNV